MSRAFGHDIPRLSWIGAKTYSQQGDSRKNHSGNAMEHAVANSINLLMAADVLAHIGEQPLPLMLTDGNVVAPNALESMDSIPTLEA